MGAHLSGVIVVVGDGLVDLAEQEVEGVGGTGRIGVADAEGPVVLFVGRLVNSKCPGDAVRAVARLREMRPGAELFLYGVCYRRR